MPTTTRNRVRDRFPNRHTEQCSDCGARIRERHDQDCRGHLGTGIRNLRAARRDLRNRFRQVPAEPVQQRPGARFYVTAVSGRRVAYLLGPYVSHLSAQVAVPRGRRLLPGGCWVAVGTASRPDTVPTVFGR